MGPLRLGLRALQRRPVPIGLQPPLQHELRLILLRRNQPDRLLAQSPWDIVRLYRSDKPPLIFAAREVLNRIHCGHCTLPDVSDIGAIDVSTSLWLGTLAATFSIAVKFARLIFRNVCRSTRPITRT